MRWILIRHGKTKGNLEGRYIGCRSDEPLCPEGRADLKQRVYPAVSRVYASPMRRCLETAGLLYPDAPVEIVPDLRECDFGTFEGITRPGSIPAENCRFPAGKAGKSSAHDA